MANKRNYQKELDSLIINLEKEGRVPKLFLHSCCAPCASYVLEYLSNYFEITVFYYNPNIYPPEEYHERAAEQKRFIEQFPAKHPISYIEGDYDTKRFYEMARGLEKVPEGGEHDKEADYIITHEPPATVKEFLDFEVRQISHMHTFFDAIKNEVKFTKWFFGKAHKNKVIPPKYHCLFDEVVQIESKLPKKKRFGKK